MVESGHFVLNGLYTSNRLKDSVAVRFSHKVSVCVYVHLVLALIQ